MGTRKPSRSPHPSTTPGGVELLLAAVRKGDLRKVKAFLTANPDFVSSKTDDGSSIVLYALYNRQMEVADFLRSRGAVLSIYDASAAGDRARVQELLTEDPRLIGFTSHDGWTPLHLASFFGQINVVEFLLDYGADMHVVSKNASSVMPLHSALANRQADTATLLLDRGADIEARQPTYEYTPLHYAAANGLESIVRRLLDSGAKTSVEGLDGKKPVDLAKEHGHRTIADLLQRNPS